jgi:biopolymer transport protein ExbB
MKIYQIMQNGGPVMWSLLACSLVVLTVVIERIIFWLQINRQRNRKLMDEVLTLAENGDWSQIKDILPPFFLQISPNTYSN